MQEKVLIFDFDGTIADTFQLTVKVCQALADEFGFKKIGPEDIKPLKGLSSRDVLKYLHVNPLKIPGILIRAREESTKAISSIEPIPELKDVLIKIKEFGYKIGILTSNSYDNVDNFLKNHKMDFFDFVKTSSKVWGKNHSINKFIKSNKLPHDNVIYVGDETRDIVAAKKAKIKSIAVTWGYNSEEVLEKHQPDCIIDSPDELLETCKNI